MPKALGGQRTRDRPGTAPDLATFGLGMLLAGLRLGANGREHLRPQIFPRPGYSASIYGMIVGLFMGGAAIGGVDRRHVERPVESALDDDPGDGLERVAPITFCPSPAAAGFSRWRCWQAC